MGFQGTAEGKPLGGGLGKVRRQWSEEGPSEPAQEKQPAEASVSREAEDRQD